MRLVILLFLFGAIVEGQRRFWSKAQILQLKADFTVLWDDISTAIAKDESGNELILHATFSFYFLN